MKAKNALLIVDVTNDFTDPNGALYVKNGEKIVDNINKIIDSNFDIVVMIQEVHPKNHKWFASNHEGKKPYQTGEINGKTEVLWPDHVVEDTWGAEIYPKLLDKLTNLKEGYYVFNKGLNPDAHPYSPFQDPSSGIAEFLLSQDVTTVAVVGLATDYCVKDTAIDASKLGFKTLLIEDAIEAVNITPTDGQNAIDEMVKEGCKKIDTNLTINLITNGLWYPISNPMEDCR